MNAKLIISLVASLFLSSFLTGCCIYKCPPSTPRDAPYAEAKLAEAATSISGSLNQLAAIEKAYCPRAKMPPPPNPVCLGMEQIVSVDWSGPVEPILNKLACASCYRLKIIGRRPAIPVMVSLTVTNETVADVMRDIMYQVIKRAEIVVYPSRRIIELRYRNC